MNRLQQINIIYESEYTDWFNNIKDTLILNNIWTNKDLINTIYNSVQNQVIDLLKNTKGFRPNSNYSYRQMVAKRLKKQNIRIEIKSNKILWIYLQYFKDLTDYSKCFVVHFINIDTKKEVKL